MAGLMSKRPGAEEDQQMQAPAADPMAQGGTPMPSGEMDEMDDADDEGGNVSPEEQEQYDKLVTQGLKLIYNKPSMPQLMKSMSGSGNPVEGAAETLVTIFMRLEDSASEAGIELNGEIKIPAATELMEHLVELAEEADVHEYSEEEMETALYRAMDLYRTARQEQGGVDQEQAAADLAELMQAEEEGRLDEMLPGASQVAQRSGGAAQAPAEGAQPPMQAGA